MTDNAVNVLIIDDDLPTRRLLKRRLSVRNYRVIEAKTGDDGLDLIRSQQPDIVILELSLPDIDGIEVISRIREVSDAPIVVLSSRSEERTKVKALLSGADDYVTKPFGTEELAARLHTALRHRFQEQGQRPIFSTGEFWSIWSAAGSQSPAMR